MAFVSRLHKHPLIRAQSATACRSVHALGSKKEDKKVVSCRITSSIWIVDIDESSTGFARVLLQYLIL